MNSQSQLNRMRCLSSLGKGEVWWCSLFRFWLWEVLWDYMLSCDYTLLLKSVRAHTRTLRTLLCARYFVSSCSISFVSSAAWLGRHSWWHWLCWHSSNWLFSSLGHGKVLSTEPIPEPPVHLRVARKMCLTTCFRTWSRMQSTHKHVLNVVSI